MNGIDSSSNRNRLSHIGTCHSDKKKCCCKEIFGLPQFRRDASYLPQLCFKAPDILLSHLQRNLQMQYNGLIRHFFRSSLQRVTMGCGKMVCLKRLERRTIEPSLRFYFSLRIERYEGSIVYFWGNDKCVGRVLFQKGVDASRQGPNKVLDSPEEKVP